MGSSGVVAIVAVTDDNELVLTEQFRRSVAGRVIDLPAGLVGDGKNKSEVATSAAQRSFSRKRGMTPAGSTFWANRPRRRASLRKRSSLSGAGTQTGRRWRRR